MKALVYHGPGKRSWDEVPRPGLRDVSDAVVRVDAVTICGTDLHIIEGDVPAVEPGRILGHEAVGTVEQIGAAVSGVKPGDRVLISCISACGRCRYCRIGMFGQCLGGGWILGHRIDGTQAEYVRVPFADTVVAVGDDPQAAVAELTDGLGADVVVEAVGVPESFELCTKLVRPGGRVANIGVHGKPATLHLEDLWIRNITITDAIDSLTEVAAVFSGAASAVVPSEGVS
jgi:alcohol dehydrogenase